MGAPISRQSVTYAEYLVLEQSTDRRHEYLDGAAWAMAGGSPRHSAVKTNLAIVVGMALRGTPCRPYDSDLKIRVPATGLATYPDLSIVCGALELDAEDPNAVTNPVMLVEVLSRATEAWDRGGKFPHYRRLDSLRHYVLVSTDEPRIERYSLGTDGSWRLSEHGAGDTVHFTGPALELPVDEVFADLPTAEEGDAVTLP